MLWKLPPRIKVYEALGCVSDKRIVLLGNTAHVYSSSRKKYYTVTWEDDKIMSNDNGSYWQGYLSYPALAVLMLLGKLPYDAAFGEALRVIHWKDINTRFKNDYVKTEAYALSIAESKGCPPELLRRHVDTITEKLNDLKLMHLGEKSKPPQGY